MKTKNLLFITLSVGFVLIACKKQGCTDINATNFNIEAKKDDGSCVYPEPEPDPREVFLGSYNVKDSLFMMGSFSEEKNYVLQITIGNTKQDTLFLNNLSNSGKNFIALVAGTNFSIPSQQVSGPYYLEGSGSFNGNEISYQTSGDVYINKGIGNK